ncbi:TonB-dependent receptor [Tenuifilaceae bacterium CYCD]|nr:TonB-dependent receptor [Tenuifilaceae bacterium CYCD]
MAVLLISQSAFSIDENDILAKGSIKGFVFDSTANQPLEYATISLVKADNKKVITGTISDASGFFKISGVEFGKYTVEITFIGYFTKKIEGVEISPKNKSIDIGQVELKPATRTMEEVVVKADRPTLQYKIDKKVINVSQQHTSASGTAAELLENIPSVTTDIDGNVSLRGSTSFTVLIDGKPTVLEPSEALAQIPASQIENIEIITNPSAKFDPDGVAGIINIIMKKNKLQGFSGIFNLNGGTQNRYGGDFLITLRKNKFNFYIGGDLNNQEFIGESTSRKYTIKNDTISYLNSSGGFTRGRYSYGVRGGLDYNINAFNTISLGFRVGNRNGSGNSDLTYNSWNSPSTYNKSYLSKENSDRGGDFYTATLDYNHNFSKKGHTLVGQFIFEKSNSSDIDITKVIDNNVISSGQKSEEDGPETEYRLKLDYTLPTGEKNKFEAGLQSRVELENTSNSMYEYNPATSTFDFQQLYSHKVDYATNIHSAYSTYSGEYNKLGYQIGLRGEYTYRFISLAGENQNFTLDRFDYYPTLHVSYTLPKDQQVMASYTRRIARSWGYNLEPFITWEDAHNVRIGNPSLKPEFIDSYELSYQKNFGKNTISIDLYYRITNNKVERITSVYDAEEQIFLNSIDNIGKDYSFGSEIMFGLDLAKWWHVDLMGNLYDYKEKGDLLGESFDKNSFNWNSRLNNTFKIGKNTRVQLNGMYNSPTVTAQGRSEGFLMTSIAAKQDFMKNKVSLTLQVRDLLHTSGHEMTSEGTDFYSYRKFKPDGPVVSMTLTVRLNNYKPDRKRQQVENNMEEMDLEN